MKFILFLLFAGITFLSPAQHRWAKAAVKSDTHSGVGILLDNGKWLIEPNYDKIVFWYKHFSVQKNGLYGCIDTTGRKLIDPKYDGVYAYENYILLKAGDTAYGAAKLNGEILLEPIYRWITNEGKYLTFQLNGMYGLMDTAGNKLLNPVFQEIRFINDVVFVMKNKRWGALDEKRNYLIAPSYEDLGSKVEGGVLRAKKNGKWGYIDLIGKVKIPFQYDEACSFEGNQALVRIGDKVWSINLNGEKLKEYGEMYECYDGDYNAVELAPEFHDGWYYRLVQFEENGKIGIKKRDGTIILQAEFDEIGEYSNNAVTVRKGQFWGAFSFDGEPLIEVNFKSLGRLKTFNSDNEYFR